MAVTPEQLLNQYNGAGPAVTPGGNNGTLDSLLNSKFPGTSQAVPGSGFLDQTGLFKGNPLTNAFDIVMHPLDSAGAVSSAAATSASQGISLISALFLRGIVVITGFIFVAVGLSMFKNNTTLLETVKSPLKGRP